MRSVKLLVAAAALTAFVAGPVLAAEGAMAPASNAPSAMAPAAADSTMKSEHGKKHHHKKGGHHHKKSEKMEGGATEAAPATEATPAQ